ncbi:response regulator [Candidatus Poribacteria bacterium]|nr:response regulator [Candidatus Poribacteria bacterium]
MRSDNISRILVVDDDPMFLRGFSRLLKSTSYKADITGASNGSEALKIVKEENTDLIFLDVILPDIDGLTLLPKIQEIQKDVSVVMITAQRDMKMVIRALRSGVADFLKKPIDLMELEAVLEKSIRFSSMNRESHRLRDTIRNIQQSEQIRESNRKFIGNSKSARDIRNLIKQAVEAQCDTILITGETGTGKEVVAREIHFQASGEDSPFIAVSCPAIPDTLVESEIFGHVKGAFTGATEDRAGSFELADGGTLFLDEVGDLSLSAQAKLLRVLETRSLSRVGSAKEISVNVRVISATNAPLEKLVEDGKFRSDLFYRLNIFSINIKPLRKRKEDIILLAEHFLHLYIKPRGIELKGFSDDAREVLLTYDYPGNARELRNIIERAAIICQYGKITPEYLNLPVNTKTYNIVSRSELENKQEDTEKARIIKALEETKWNRSKAAKKLQMSYSKLRYRLRKYGIS